MSQRPEKAKSSEPNFHEIELERGRSGHVAIVHFKHHDLVSPRILQDARQDLEQALEQDELECLIIDFSDVKHASSSLFGLILHLAEHARELGRVVRVCGMQTTVMKAFALLNAHHIVDVYPDRRSAVLDEKPAADSPWWKFW